MPLLSMGYDGRRCRRVIKASHGDCSCLILSSIESLDGRSIYRDVDSLPLPPIASRPWRVGAAASWPAIKIMLVRNLARYLVRSEPEGLDVVASTSVQLLVSPSPCNPIGKDFAPAMRSPLRTGGRVVRSRCTKYCCPMKCN